VATDVSGPDSGSSGGFVKRLQSGAIALTPIDPEGMAAARATPTGMAAMADAMTSMFASLDDPQAFLVCDIRFHRAVADASGNKILASLVEMVSALFYERRKSTADRQRHLKATADAHFRIYQAIRDRNRTLAERLMSEHLIEAERSQQAEGPDSAEESPQD
jgi:GntR family transcriptional repressor for pyruvate dehydrogenase complex